jgi:3-hydroxyacyl-[acyl-carrier-protein] dehydratase
MMLMSLSEIHAAIPHREPFLLIDEIVEQTDRSIVCSKTFSGNDWFFAGHYPDYPLVPGVLLCEAAMQAGAAMLSKISDGVTDKMPVVTRMNEVRFKRTVRPGETIEIEVSLREKLADAFFFDAKVTCGGKLAVRFDFACMLAAKNEAAA